MVWGSWVEVLDCFFGEVRVEVQVVMVLDLQVSYS